MKKKDKQTKWILKTILMILLLVFVYYYEDIESYLNKGQENISNVSVSDDNIQITYLDVGQADCTLIRYKNNNILIDAGNNEDGEKIVSYLKEQGINNFKYVIGTHAHEDHIGGMDEIIDNFKINHFYMPDVITTTKTFEDILDSLENNNVKFETPKIGENIKIDDMKLQILYVGRDKEDLNDTSIITRIVFKNTSYIFMGDASSKVENQLLDKDIESDVLKVGHHGSQYSSSAKFLKTVNPKYAIIQVGKNNTYNHPKKIVLDKLNKMNVQIYRTDKDGTIILTSDGKNISIEKKETDTNG